MTNTPKLVITVGISASGKSTWANAQENYRVICRDDIRGRLFPEYHQGDYKMTKMKESRVSAEALNEWQSGHIIILSLPYSSVTNSPSKPHLSHFIPFFLMYRKRWHVF